MIHSPETDVNKKPPWLKVRFPSHPNFFYVSNLLKKKQLHTICQSAKCPNIAECWSHKTATFLILGDVCTRQCSFCAVKKGFPESVQPDEAERVVEAVLSMELRYAVITSVTRDDLPDHGASVYADTIVAIRERAPKVKVEVLVPDFGGKPEPLKSVLDARPDILNHNLEVPEILYQVVQRPKQHYARSVRLLEAAKAMGAVTKSGLIVGLGEQHEDILQVFSDLRRADCDFITIGQYLQPSKAHAPVKKFYTPREFEQMKQIALDFGFEAVQSGPLVRSSYMAHKMYRRYEQKGTH